MKLPSSSVFVVSVYALSKSTYVTTEFDEKLWLAVIDKVTVSKDGTMTFEFRNGSIIEV